MSYRLCQPLQKRKSTQKKVTNSPNAAFIDAYSILYIRRSSLFSLPLLTSSPSLQLPAVPFSTPPHHQLGKHSDTRSQVRPQPRHKLCNIYYHKSPNNIRALFPHPILPISFHCTNLVCWQPCCTALQTLFKGPSPAPPFHN